MFHASQATVVATPVLVSLTLFTGLGLVASERRPEVDEIIESINTDGPGQLEPDSRAAVAAN